MTEKERFELKDITFDGLSIIDHQKQEYYTYDKQDLQKLCKTLNELNKENIKLKTANQRWEKICCEGLRINDRLRKKIIKNEELDEYGKSL